MNLPFVVNDATYDTVQSVEPTKEARISVPNTKITALEDYSYPKEWFDKNLGKPTIALDEQYTDHLQNWTHTVVTQWEDGSLTAETALTFVFAAFHSKPEIAERDWASFGRVIAVSQAECRLGDLANITLKTDAVALKEGTHIYPAETISAYIIAICAVYRFHSAILMDSYKEDLIKKLNKLLGSSQTNIKFQVRHTAFANWLSSPNYEKMCAFVDMYCNFFPKHDYAKARFGTIVTRYKDCAALLTLPYIMETLGINLPRLAVWLWVPASKQEMINLMKEGQEMSEPYSYALYFIPLGLSNRSPYSSTLNKNIHLICHLIGAGRSQKRSIHARLIGTPDFSSCSSNAATILYAHGVSTNMKVGFAPHGIEFQDKKSKRPKSHSSEEFPTTRDPLTWAFFMHSRGFRNDDRLLYQSNVVWSQLADTRDDTVGRMAKDLARSYLEDYNNRVSLRTKQPQIGEQQVRKEIKSSEDEASESDESEEEVGQK